MKAIQTRYLGMTESRAPRVVARTDGQRMTVPYDHGLDTHENHAAAAKALASKLGWGWSYVGGTLPDGSMAWVHSTQEADREELKQAEAELDELRNVSQVRAGALVMRNRKLVAEHLRTAARTHPDEYVRCVIGSVANACQHGLYAGPWRGRTDLEPQVIRTLLLEEAQEELEVARTESEEMRPRLQEAGRVLRGLSFSVDEWTKKEE